MYCMISLMNVAAIRKIRGWSQTDLADVVNVEQATISRIENGSDGVTLRVIKDIAAALEVPVYTLFMDDFSEAEIQLLDVYRSLSPERKKGWQDMAQSVLVQPQTDDQPIHASD